MNSKRYVTLSIRVFYCTSAAHQLRAHFIPLRISSTPIAHTFYSITCEHHINLHSPYSIAHAHCIN